jgi:hypothetical protein
MCPGQLRHQRKCFTHHAIPRSKRQSVRRRETDVGLRTQLLQQRVLSFRGRHRNCSRLAASVQSASKTKEVDSRLRSAADVLVHQRRAIVSRDVFISRLAILVEEFPVYSIMERTCVTVIIRQYKQDRVVQAPVRYIDRPGHLVWRKRGHCLRNHIGTACMFADADAMHRCFAWRAFK